MKKYLLCVAYYSDEKGFCVRNAVVPNLKMTTDSLYEIRKKISDELSIKDASKITILNIMKVK